MDGASWGNDYPSGTTHESWFWHNQAGARVASVADGKLLMNIGDPGFASYWKESLASQVTAGDYDGVFADSASPDLLTWEAQDPPEPRLAGTGARDTPVVELGGSTRRRRGGGSVATSSTSAVVVPAHGAAILLR